MNQNYRSRCVRSRWCGRWLAAAVLTVFGSWVGNAHALTLQELINGGSLTVGGSRFSDWQLISSDATSGVLPNLSLITVNPLAGDPFNPGLQYAAGNQLSVTGINAIDLLFKYRVSGVAASSPFTGHALSMSGIAFGGAGGIAYISSEVRSYLGDDLGPAVVIADNESGVSQMSASSSFAAQPGVVVTTNVFMTGISSADSINLPTITQQFGQSGPPLLAGDYNGDGVVNAADYVVWRKKSGPEDGYVVWRTEFGRPGNGSSAVVGTGGNAAVPEPALIPHLLIVIMLITFARARVPSNARDQRSRLYCC